MESSYDSLLTGAIDKVIKGHLACVNESMVSGEEARTKSTSIEKSFTDSLEVIELVSLSDGCICSNYSHRKWDVVESKKEQGRWLFVNRLTGKASLEKPYILRKKSVWKEAKRAHPEDGGCSQKDKKRRN